MAFACALVGGITATTTWLGMVVSSVVGVFWWWVPLALFVVLGVLIVGDVVADWLPNRWAIYGSVLWPSLWLSVEGALGRTLRGWITGINDPLNRTVSAWITDTPRGSAAVLTAIAVVAISFAIMYAEKYAKKARGARPAQAAAQSSQSPKPLPAGRG